MLNACYLLFTDGGPPARKIWGGRTYIGATHDPDRRLRQHNRELAGGASSTAGKIWNRALYVSGFPDWRATLQFEWMWKHIGKKHHGLQGKMDSLVALLRQGKSTSNSVPFRMYNNCISLTVNPDFRCRLEKIESFQILLSMCGSSQSSLQTSFLLSSVSPSPLPFLSKMSSVVDMSSLAVSVELLKTEVEQLKSRLETALANIAAAPAADAAAPKKRGRKAKAAEGAESGAESSAAEDKPAKKARKPREPKEKPTCPAAAEGTVRFYSCAGDNKYKSFSNLYRAPFTLDGKEYGSSENYFQSQKFVGTDDEYAEKIRTTKNPVLVAGMGRSKSHPIRADWETVKQDIMRRALDAKFAAHSELKDLLLGTGSALIEEEAAIDSYWGIGADGKGENWLGKLLMELREKLSPAAAPAAPAAAPAAEKPKATKAKKPAAAATTQVTA